jgi:D-amino-acid oxidase
MGMGISRRQALQLGASALIGLSAPAIIGARTASAAGLRGGQILPTPEFRLHPADYKCVAGVRPHRTGGVKLGLDPDLGRAQGKHVIHNFGHGGGGITLSFGCALRVRGVVQKLIDDAPRHAPLPKVVILGSGVAGLTVAKELRDTWPALKIRILTKSKSVRDSTSHIAGGQFAPSGINVEYDRAGTLPVLASLLKDSAARIKRMFDDGSYRRYGVRQRKNYSARDLSDFKPFVPDVFDLPNIDRLPFAHLKGYDGYEYGTWLIEPPILLAELVRELGVKRVPILWSHPVRDQAAMLRLPEEIIVNCSGLGAKDLIENSHLVPIKGQLVVLKNPLNLKYFVSGCGAGHDASYLFGRSNDLVLGGTYLVGDDSTDTDPDVCQGIIDRMKAIFAGDIDSCLG